MTLCGSEVAEAMFSATIVRLGCDVGKICIAEMDARIISICLQVCLFAACIAIPNDASGKCRQFHAFLQFYANDVVTIQNNPVTYQFRQAQW